MQQKSIKFFLFSISGVIFLYFLFSLFHIITTFAPDFNVYYRSGYDLLHQQSLYTDKVAFTNFGYPPVTALLYVPFALFPFQIAQDIYIVLSAFAVFACVYLVLSLVTQKINLIAFLITSCFFILSFPTKFTLGMGQSNLLAYASLLLSLVFYVKNQKQFWIIFFVALACLLKPLMIFFLLFFIVEKQWKIFFSILFFLCVVTLGMFFLFPTSFAETLHYLTKILPDMIDIHGRGVYYNQGLMGFMFRTFGEGIVQKYITEIISVILLGITIFISLRQTTYAKIALLLSVLPIIDSLSWQHHFVFLLFPFVYMFFLLQKKGNSILWFLLGMIYALVSANIKNPEIFSLFPYILILSHTFYGALLLWILIVGSINKTNSVSLG